jgi:DNA-binding transcriptional MocR family regulator
MWTVPPLGAAIASQWVADGTALSLVAAKRAETQERQALAAQLLPMAWRRQTSEASMHLWLHLPPSLRADEAARRVLSVGVRVTPGAAFAVGRSPNAVRLSLGAPERREDLATALRALSAALTA